MEIRIEDFIKKAREMSPSEKGGNKECFYIDEYALLKSNGIEETKLQQTMETEKELKTKGINITSTLAYKVHSKDINKEFKRGYILQEKAKGVPVHMTERLVKMNKEEIDRVGDAYIDELNLLQRESQGFYDKFVSDWIEIIKAGLRIDPSKTNNFYYQQGKQINFIDLNVNEKFEGNVNLDVMCFEMAVVLADGIKYNNPFLNNNYPELRGQANNALSDIFSKLILALNEQGMDKKLATEIISTRFPEVKLYSKDTRGQAQKETIGKSQEQYEREKKDEEAGKRIEKQTKEHRECTSDEINKKLRGKSLKQDILNASITRAEIQQQTKSIEDATKIKRLMYKQKSGSSMTEEEKSLIEQHIRQTNEAQVRFTNQQNKKKMKGIEM